MKKMKKMIALLIAMAMVLSMGITAFAGEQEEPIEHTITIENKDQNVTHSYEAYQVFKGTLDSQQQVLTNIEWGDGVNGEALLAALKASTDTDLAGKFDSCTTAADVAKVLQGFASTSATTSSTGAIDKVAAIIAENLKTKAADFTAHDDKTYTATVSGDGYYFIKDTTSTLTDDETKGWDTLSKYLLAIVKDTTIVAKDTGDIPDKEIVEGQERVKETSANVGDEITFEVTITVPNTKKYEDHFIFNMDDQLPTGLTFMEIKSIKVGSDDVPYTLTSPANYTKPATTEAAVNATGGQKIEVVFNDFKAAAEENNWIGEKLIITYTAVVNKNADFTPTGNINEVEFKYANDPNHVYNGDTPEPEEPVGTTPKDKTKVLLINLIIYKTGDNGTVEKLEGAEFEISSDTFKMAVLTGEKYEKTGYTCTEGESVVDTGYYLLKDGKYTKTAPKTDPDTTAYYDDTEQTYDKIAFTKYVASAGDAKKITAYTNADGQIVLNGVNAGTYTIKETNAPEGYNVDPNTYTIKIDWDPNAKEFVKNNASSEGVVFDENTAIASVTIDDKSGAELPSTGGIGTTMFYIAGAVLVLGAGVLLVSRRRMSE